MLELIIHKANSLTVNILRLKTRKTIKGKIYFSLFGMKNVIAQ